MAGAEQLQNDVFNYVAERGDMVRFKYWTVGSTGVDDYDDQQVLTQDGADAWQSGLVQTVSLKDLSSSHMAVLRQQGKIREGDKKIYFDGTINVSGTFQVGVGSPVREEYSIIPGGINTEFSNGSPIYHKCFMRILPNGSLAGTM
jgi:hypothetical protein|tara:strand:+ start:6255 stop:6689 length:435 start_codon:yes stop_codon:yes gene_type:complete